MKRQRFAGSEETMTTSTINGFFDPPPITVPDFGELNSFGPHRQAGKVGRLENWLEKPNLFKF